jgi:hypothetical protein
VHTKGSGQRGGTSGCMITRPSHAALRSRCDLRSRWSTRSLGLDKPGTEGFCLGSVRGSRKLTVAARSPQQPTWRRAFAVLRCAVLTCPAAHGVPPRGRVPSRTQRKCGERSLCVPTMLVPLRQQQPWRPAVGGSSQRMPICFSHAHQPPLTPGLFIQPPLRCSCAGCCCPAPTKNLCEPHTAV